MVQTVNWLAFGVNFPDVKTNLHFFPYSGSISSTYPVELSITIFGQGLESLNVTMEGARLSQPDGLAIEKIFPALLANYSGSFGLLIGITLNSEQTVDLSPSFCVVELRKDNSSVRFTPKSLNNNSGEVVALGLNSEKLKTSIIAVNCDSESAPIGIMPGICKASRNSVNQLDSYSINEFQLSEDYLNTGTKQNCALGPIIAQKIAIKPKSGKTAYFSIQRSNSGLPLNVQSL